MDAKGLWTIKGPDQLNRQICDSKLRVCIFLGCLHACKTWHSKMNESMSCFPPNHGETKQPLPELLEPGLCRLLPVGSGSLLLGNYEAELFFFITYSRLVV